MFVRYRKNGGQVLGETLEADPADIGWEDTDLEGVIEYDVTAITRPHYCDGVDVTTATQGQQDAWPAAEAADVVAVDRGRAKSRFVTLRELEALVEVIRGEINILRDKHGLDARTWVQIKNAINNKIDGA